MKNEQDVCVLFNMRLNYLGVIKREAFTRYFVLFPKQDFFGNRQQILVKYSKIFVF